MSDLLLVILADGRARHGYALVRMLCESSVLAVSPGHVQRDLRRLLDRVMVEVVPAPPSFDPQRVLYRITAAGRDAAAAWLSAPVRGLRRRSPDALALRLAALEAMPREQARVFLDQLAMELSFRRECLMVERSRTAIDGDTTTGAALLYERELRHLEADREVVEIARGAVAARVRARAAT